MAGLLADGWFYISSAGLLVSGVLFFFLLGQYRAANDAADQPEPEAAAEPHSPLVRPLSVSDQSPSSEKVASVSPVDKPAEKAPATVQQAPPEPKREAPPAQADNRREATTSGVNPAVVYLQNIKSQLAEIHKETRDLSKRMETISSRDEALIERLAELAQAVAELKKDSSVAAARPALASEAPVPARAKKASPAAASAAPLVLSIEPPASAPAPEPKAEVKPVPAVEALFSAEEVTRMDLKPAAEAPPAAAELFTPAVEPSKEPESGEKPRRGPVWPV